jgi:alanine dehydrogenase
MIKSIGLPTMHKEKSEVRAFLPSFAEALSQYDVDVFIEADYGQKMGYTPQDYVNENSRVTVASHEDVYQKDLVIVLKAPNLDEIDLMKKGAGLMSMLHYESRPALREKMLEKEIHCFSMDAIADDFNQRLVVSYEQTAWGGISTAIDEMEKRRNDFYAFHRGPYQIAIFGMGNLGLNAGKMCFEYFKDKFEKRNLQEMISGVVVSYIGKDSLKNKNDFRSLLTNVDLLIDATKRADFTKCAITNDLIGCLKDEAVILDLTADPYDDTSEPLQGKAFEGIPYGTLDKFVFETDAIEYDLIPSSVATAFRRVVVSCNAWPGVVPEKSMKIYEEKLAPFVAVLMDRAFFVSEKSQNPFEKALAKSALSYYLKTEGWQ